jgi:hypothetical protein
MTALETNTSNDAQLSSLAAKIGDASRIGLLAFASAIISNDDSLSDVVQTLSQPGQQALSDLRVAIDWLRDSPPADDHGG